MSDPAIEAARVTLSAFHAGRLPSTSGTAYPSVEDVARSAAREALEPVRAKIGQWQEAFNDHPTPEAAIAQAVLDDLSHVVFSTDA